MTTSAQQTTLTVEELACLRAIAEGVGKATEDPTVAALVAKGMLETDDAARHTLTPAGLHAVNVAGPGEVPGIDS